jgi:hypothetical protein
VTPLLGVAGARDWIKRRGSGRIKGSVLWRIDSVAITLKNLSISSFIVANTVNSRIRDHNSRVLSRDVGSELLIPFQLRVLI